MGQSLPPAEALISQDDAFIANALKRASIPALMMSMIHMSGDESLLAGPIRPGRAGLGDEQGGMSPDEKEEVRARALEIIKAYRDGGCRLPPPPSHDTILEMMGFLVGESVPEEYVPMMLEEMALDGQDAREPHWHCEADFRVLVIGAGMSGILAAIRLGEAGVPFEIVEKNAGVGGTWLENSYPGCRVDVANHFYCYSFEPNSDWPEYFSQQPELRGYFEKCASRHGIAERIRFGTEVVSARYDEAAGGWQVCMRSGEGDETQRFDAIVSAVGQLNRPKIPDIPGSDSFEGPSFHSAAWEHDHDLAGKRVAVIGTGASAYQLVPEVAKTAGRLSVFQRSPGWAFPNPRYHTRVSEEKKWLLAHLPYYSRWYRFLLFWPGSDGLLPSLRIDPDWPHPERSINATNEAVRIHFTQVMKAQVGDDPELLEKIVPKYPPFGKRILQDNGAWLAALKRENVALVSDGIREITRDAIVCEDGSRYPVDVIVYATGFHANKFLWPMQVIGREGRELREVWGEDPQAYLGITVPGFPNLFCLYGPGTNLAHAGSIIFHSECQVRYVLGCLEALLTSGHRAMDCRKDVHDDYNRRMQEEHRSLVWSHPGMNSWYKNPEGRVTTTSPWRLVDYWRWTKTPALEDYELT
jgi:4-hydroxyacetophenone monooxygenase